MRLRGEVTRLRIHEAEAALLRAENERLRARTTVPAKMSAAKEGEDFLAANATKEGVRQTASGLQYKVISSGTGRTPKIDDKVKVHYHGTRIDGTVFDSSVERGEPASARLQLERLQELVRQLDIGYALKIVNRGNEYSRIWYNNANRTGKLYYVIVEAVGSNGQAIPMQITSEQDGSTRLVNCWAERVDEATYEAVGADKKDDGVIQHDIFGIKERGYLSPRYLMGTKINGDDPGKGRLNRWPKK